MLMAAGLGTRLRPFTDLLPKPLLPVLGIPMAQYTLDRLAEAGVTNVVANYSHLPEVTRSGLARLDRRGMELRLSDESALLLGSAGGIARALPLLGDGAFYLVNSDVLCDVDLKALAIRHALLRDRWGVKMTLTLFPQGPVGGKYREIHGDPETGLVTGFGGLEERKPYFVGSAVLEPEALEGIPADRPGEFVPLILERAIRERKCGFFVGDGLWLDVGSPRLWLEAHLALLRRLELGALPVSWRHRIESVNERLAPELWMVRGEGVAARLKTMEWSAPAYWGDHETLPAVGELPQSLGPRAVRYGRLARNEDPARTLTDGIGFGGLWSSADSLT